MAEIKRGQNEEKVSDEETDEEKVSGTNGTVENNRVFLRGFFEQFGFEYVSGPGHEFVSVSPPLEDARLEAVRAVGNFATCQLLKCTGDTVGQLGRIQNSA